jgi:Flp pilus assembly protein TadG
MTQLLIRIRSRRAAPHGQALVEFALIVPIFVLLLVGIFDLGRGVYAYSTINNAAREGVRLEIVDQMCLDIKSRAMQHAVALGVSASAVTVEVLQPDGTPYSPARVCPANPSATDSLTAAIGDIAHVKVAYTFSAATPGINLILGSIAMLGETKQPIEATCVVGPPPVQCPIGS